MDPKQRPTATQMVLSSVLSPKLEMESALSEAPDSLAETAKSQEQDMSLGAVSRRYSLVLHTLETS